jgi:hypothetical protein
MPSAKAMPMWWKSPSRGGCKPEPIPTISSMIVSAAGRIDVAPGLTP